MENPRMATKFVSLCSLVFLTFILPATQASAGPITNLNLPTAGEWFDHKTDSSEFYDCDPEGDLIVSNTGSIEAPKWAVTEFWGWGDGDIETIKTWSAFGILYIKARIGADGRGLFLQLQNGSSLTHSFDLNTYQLHISNAVSCELTTN